MTSGSETSHQMRWILVDEPIVVELLGVSPIESTADEDTARIARPVDLVRDLSLRPII